MYIFRLHNSNDYSFAVGIVFHPHAIKNPVPAAGDYSALGFTYSYLQLSLPAIAKQCELDDVPDTANTDLVAELVRRHSLISTYCNNHIARFDASICSR